MFQINTIVFTKNTLSIQYKAVPLCSEMGGVTIDR